MAVARARCAKRSASSKKAGGTVKSECAAGGAMAGTGTATTKQGRSSSSSYGGLAMADVATPNSHQQAHQLPHVQPEPTLFTASADGSLSVSLRRTSILENKEYINEIEW